MIDFRLGSSTTASASVIRGKKKGWFRRLVEKIVEFIKSIF